MDRRDLVVRRVRADDAKRVADFVNRALRGRANIEPRAVIARAGEVGFLLAEEDHTLLGLLGWHVENLVACVTDLLIWPARERQRVGQALFREMESAALSLQAEASLLCLPPRRVPQLIAYLQDVGYLLDTVNELPRAWREMARRAGYEDQDEIPVKELRSDRVVRPL